MGRFFSKTILSNCGAIRLPVFVNIRTFLKLAIGSRRIMTNQDLTLSFLFVFGKAAVASHHFLANVLLLKYGAFPKSAVGSYMCVRMCTYVYICIYICI